ncbi:glutathione S-transferase [Amorphus orientalis]|uniref:Glutathione S-transferase n=2 Tax=Amorphus orientalis TaxID=649198 RepID=A0AAE3VRU9_9HYPH|nr:glutathione S-transferase [Amorphus orientalis]
MALAEYDTKVELVTEHVWQNREAFLRLNPAGEVPVVIENDGPPLCGANVIMEYLEDTRGYAAGKRRMMPDNPDARAEVRRLCEWFLSKFHAEVSDPYVRERIYKVEMPAGAGGGAPDSASLRTARQNMRHHLRYLGHLVSKRDWIAGDAISFADLAAATAVSVVDYLGEVPWNEDDAARSWYARMKSRPSFRPILAEIARGVRPAHHYADLDF